ncbi:ancient ubiquitous protein 1-like [Orbicella faveolata]|uniref:ancient ubiquitous protein 1-like n=1 Tax=Orbicella faveolata TaxID=48498 RepID=UPI0009E51CF3|nr:ancient ubiquitous protein 1-like [Orbicella faveolata]
MVLNSGLTDLLNRNRLPDGGALLLILLYIPCGLFLVIFRIFFALQLFLILSILPKESFVRRILFRVSSAILGIAVTQEGCENFITGQHKVVVSNHVTSLDNVAIETILPSVMPYSRCDCPWLIKWLLGYEDLSDDKDKENTDSKIKEYLQGSGVPLLAFPEEQITNGKRGLLKFNPWCFQFSSTILPVLISVRRPLIVQIPPHVLESGWWQDLFWSMFVPYTLYHIRLVLTCEVSTTVNLERWEDVDVRLLITTYANNKHLFGGKAMKKDLFEKIAEQFTKASILNIHRRFREATERAQARVQAHETRSVQNGSTPSNQDSASPNTRLMRMVQQVKEVLPQVPSPSIARDLSRTHCVDTTITNILEGRVSYIPEKEGNEAKSTSDVQSTSSGLSSETTPTRPQTITFSRLPDERQKLLSQRKKEMLENARRRFRNSQA